MWNQNGGEEASYHPPMTPEKYAQAFLGFLEGTQVDAFVSGLGWASGYQVIYPTEVEGMEFIVDRIESDVPVGTVKDWQYAENVRRIWEAGFDPIRIRIDEARRLGIDYWAHLHMNDWHHLEVLDGERNILSSRFHEQRRDLLIGEEGTSGLPEGDYIDGFAGTGLASGRQDANPLLMRAEDNLMAAESSGVPSATEVTQQTIPNPLLRPIRPIRIPVEKLISIDPRDSERRRESPEDHRS